MKTIQATEAKTRLAEFLRAVERGKGFGITRHGKVIAHLVPATMSDRDARREAVARFRSRRKQWSRAPFSMSEIRDARHDGHRA